LNHSEDLALQSLENSASGTISSLMQKASLAASGMLTWPALAAFTGLAPSSGGRGLSRSQGATLSIEQAISVREAVPAPPAKISEIR
jgi:hypothetical protein